MKILIYFIRYLAPEMINKSGHSLTLDYYCVGVFIYELAAGFPPTLGNKKSAIFTNILSEIKFPNHFSPSLKSLISRLMDKNPIKRLGAFAGVKEIFEHEWFQPLTIEKISAKSNVPPIKPNVYNFYVDKEIQKKAVNCFDFFCFDECSSTKDPLFQKFTKFSFSSMSINESNFVKKKVKKEYLKEASEMIMTPLTRPLEFLKGDLNDEEYVEFLSSMNLKD